MHTSCRILGYAKLAPYLLRRKIINDCSIFSLDHIRTTLAQWITVDNAFVTWQRYAGEHSEHAVTVWVRPGCRSLLHTGFSSAWVACYICYSSSSRDPCPFSTGITLDNDM